MNEIAKALVALQGELSPVSKDSENPFFKSKYAGLPEVMKTLQPLLKAHKLAISQFPTSIDGQPALRTILMHESGQHLEDTMLLKMAKDDPQGQGSALTYARRYSVMAITGLVADEDDDGNQASLPPKTAQSVNSQPVTDKQLKLISGLLIRLQTDKETRDKIISEVKTITQASGVIEELNKKIEAKNTEEAK